MSHAGLEADPVKLLEELLLLLAQRPELVQVAAKNEDGRLSFEVRLHAADVALLKGRSGQTIRSLRTIVEASAAKVGYRVTSLEIAERLVEVS